MPFVHRARGHYHHDSNRWTERHVVYSTPSVLLLLLLLSAAAVCSDEQWDDDYDPLTPCVDKVKCKDYTSNDPNDAPEHVHKPVTNYKPNRACGCS